MIPTTGNPYDCDDVDLLREWIVELQQLATLLREMVHCSRKQIEAEEQITSLNERKATALEEMVMLLKQRISQYEIAFSAEHYNHVRRLN
ncbi:hypothetical protein [Spirosoma panaciterrae]|uniref:hypothetical protein n=1 Tax=Spirosoma panaciterrae TaxID=496058 RepID=UPI000382081F|nr:hypothetical protein [Spirosoma panaciterrae]